MLNYAVKVNEASAHSVYVKKGPLRIVAVRLAVLLLLGLYLPNLSENDAPQHHVLKQGLFSENLL